MSIKYTEQSRIFKDFRSIPYSDYYYLIRYYEQHHQEIDSLPLEEGMIMSFYYTNALFETGEFNIHIPSANILLENSIINNIDCIDGIDIYTTILYQKTYAHLQLGATTKATQLAKQLVGIDARQYRHVDLLRQCYLAVRPRWIHPTLIMSAITTIVAAVVIITFASLHIYTEANAMLMPYSLLALAACGLVATAIAYSVYIEAPVQKITKAAKRKKRY
jgi:hypothetical protein